MAGIYIHIPYCRQKCNYCNFFSIVSSKSAPQMIAAIKREIELRSSENGSNIIQTVYLGGGTPSMLDKTLLSDLFDCLRDQYEIAANSEITLEANPDDINKENLIFWKMLGINRLSIGIQSFSNDDLQYLNRSHDASKALDCIAIAKENGFPDLTIDLIYGIPTLSNEQWLKNLQQFLDLDIPHLSAYSLTVEPKTPLYHKISKGEIQPVDEKQSTDQFLLLMDFMEKNGFQHYEISNFCKPNKHAKHNLSYWKGIEYLGFGPSAHSFNGITRKWNVSSVTEYIKGISNNILPNEVEELTDDDKYNEYIMTGLRTIWGCKLSEIRSNFGEEYADYFIENSLVWINNGMLTVTGDDNYILTRNGKLQADGIASDLFKV